MVAQNRYRIERNYKSEQGWSGSGWIDDDSWETADTWQEAIQKWVDGNWGVGTYEMVSETPSEDGRSGTTEMLIKPIELLLATIKATLIDD